MSRDVLRSRVMILLLLSCDLAMGQVAAVPESADPATPADLMADDGDEQPVSRFKRQAVQQVVVAGGWLAAVGDDDLSSRYFETKLTLAVPLGSFDNILGITPSFRMDFLNAAPELDVPAELFETGVSFFYRRPVHERVQLVAIVRPTIRSDFTTSDQALRFFGLGLINWECVPDTLSVGFGVVALGRADLPVLPAAGLTWTPGVRTKFELRFPESRLSHRLFKDGAASETWSYVSLGLGGNTWAVTRAAGETDALSLRDLRLLLGVDQIVKGGGGWFAECGYAFARRLEYETGGEEISLSDGVLLQAGWRY